MLPVTVDVPVRSAEFEAIVIVPSEATLEETFEFVKEPYL